MKTGRVIRQLGDRQKQTFTEIHRQRDRVKGTKTNRSIQMICYRADRKRRGKAVRQTYKHTDRPNQDSRRERNTAEQTETDVKTPTDRGMEVGRH